MATGRHLAEDLPSRKFGADRPRGLANGFRGNDQPLSLFSLSRFFSFNHGYIPSSATLYLIDLLPFPDRRKVRGQKRLDSFAVNFYFCRFVCSGGVRPSPRASSTWRFASFAFRAFR